jgi:preprotein translocase subunit SecB
MHIKSIDLDSMVFHRNKAFDPEGEAAGLSYKMSLAHKFDISEKTLSVELRVLTPGITEGENLPFAFDVAVSGIFEFDEDIDSKVLDQFKDINCPAIMFPYLREAVADTVRRSGFPPLHLPPVNFIEAKRKKAEVENKV